MYCISGVVLVICCFWDNKVHTGPVWWRPRLATVHVSRLFFWSYSFNALAVVALSLGPWELTGSNEQENSSLSLIWHLCSYRWWPLILEVVLAMLSDVMLLKLVRRVLLNLVQYVCIKCSSLKPLPIILDSILWETVTFDWLLKL